MARTLGSLMVRDYRTPEGLNALSELLEKYRQAIATEGLDEKAREELARLAVRTAERMGDGIDHALQLHRERAAERARKAAPRKARKLAAEPERCTDDFARILEKHETLEPECDRCGYRGPRIQEDGAMSDAAINATTDE
jgi:hypothetical protein